MLQLLVLGLVVGSAWVLRSPAPAFLRGFASLLQRPEIGRASLQSRLAGSGYVGGEIDGRSAVLLVRTRRGKRLGYLTVALKTTVNRQWDGSLPLPGPVGVTPNARNAFDTLTGKHHLSLVLDEGWLKVTWSPMGPFVFPGPFDEQKWRAVLRCLHEMVTALESANSAPPSPGNLAISLPRSSS